jgi:hypothetical protein
MKEKCLLYNQTEGRVAHAIAAAERRCISHYGYASNPRKPTWENVTTALANMHPTRYFARPSNVMFHNLCTTITPPPGCASLLGLGHKYCIQTTRLALHTKSAIFRLSRQVRLRHWLKSNAAASSATGMEYIPSLYVRSNWNPPWISEGNMELAMMAFANRIDVLATTASRRRRHSNLTPQQHRLIRVL